MVNVRVPDFFLILKNDNGLAPSRACYRHRRVRTEIAADALLVRIRPAFEGSRYALSGQDVDEVVVASRLPEAGLFPIAVWPLQVLVARPLTTTRRKRRFRAAELEAIGWGQLYRTELDARTGPAREGAPRRESEKSSFGSQSFSRALLLAVADLEV